MAVKKTSRQEDTSVFLAVRKNEFLLYRVIVAGDQPMFVIADEKGNVIMTSQNLPPKKIYEQRWPDANPSTAKNQQHTIVGMFIAAVKYTYQVEHHKSDGTVHLAIDIDYERVKPFQAEDRFRQSLGVKPAF